jgi:REP element-mobilizing transposase RayT
MAHPPRIPVWIGEDRDVVYFITICEESRLRAWDNQEFFSAFRSAVQRLEEKQLWFVYSAVIMPDHLHLLASPLKSREQRVGNLSGALKRWTREVQADPDWEWQPGSFDHLLRREESAQEKWEYMRENPVRAGLVAKWQDWPWKIGFREPGGADAL